MDAIRTTICMSGIRLTAPEQALDVSWRVGAFGGELADPPRFVPAVRVRWRTIVNGGAPSLWNDVDRTERRPNFSAAPSRTPGVTSRMAPFPGWGATIIAGKYAGGTIVVEAEARDLIGELLCTLPAIAIYNDSDAVDRRPSAKVVYCDADTGSDSNDGLSWATAVRTIHKAISLCRANPAGSSNADADCGGATIYGRGTFIGGGGGSPGAWHCSGEWPLTIIADAAGMTWKRANPPFFTSPDDYVSCPGNGAGTKCYVRTIGVRYLGMGPVGLASVPTKVWADGGSHESKYWDPAKPIRAIYREDDAPSVWTFDGGQASASRVYATCVARRGCATGFNGYQLVYDCSVKGFLGQALYLAGDAVGATYSCITVETQSYTPGVNGVLGWVRHTGGAGFEIELQGGGVARLLGPVGGYDFGADAADIVGSTYWGIGLYSFPTAANNGTFPVVGTGVAGGRSYVDFTNAAAVAEIGGTSSNIETSSNVLGSAPYNQRIHPDGIFYGPNRPGDDITIDISFADCRGLAQILFFDGFDQTRLWIENVRDDGRGWQVNFGDASWTNSIMRRCTLSGTLFIHHYLAAEALNFSGLEITNCVFGNCTANAQNILALGAVVDSCHMMTGATLGTNGTTGPWFLGDPTVSPYSMEPQAGRKGDGSLLLADAAEWAWNAARSTRGVTKQVALIDWSVGENPVSATMTPGPADSVAETVDPVFELGPAAMSAGNADTVSETVLTAIVAGGATMTPQPVESTAETVAPTFVRGPASMSPQPIECRSTTTVPFIFTHGSDGDLWQAQLVVLAPARPPQDELP